MAMKCHILVVDDVEYHKYGKHSLAHLCREHGKKQGVLTYRRRTHMAAEDSPKVRTAAKETVPLKKRAVGRRVNKMKTTTLPSYKRLKTIQSINPFTEEVMKEFPPHRAEPSSA
jgi:hypothetical protein